MRAKLNRLVVTSVCQRVQITAASLDAKIIALCPCTHTKGSKAVDDRRKAVALLDAQLACSLKDRRAVCSRSRDGKDGYLIDKRGDLFGCDRHRFEVGRVAHHDITNELCANLANVFVGDLRAHALEHLKSARARWVEQHRSYADFACLHNACRNRDKGSRRGIGWDRHVVGDKLRRAGNACRKSVNANVHTKRAEQKLCVVAALSRLGHACRTLRLQTCKKHGAFDLRRRLGAVVADGLERALRRLYQGRQSARRTFDTCSHRRQRVDNAAHGASGERGVAIKPGCDPQAAYETHEQARSSPGVSAVYLKLLVANGFTRKTRDLRVKPAFARRCGHLGTQLLHSAKA